MRLAHAVIPAILFLATGNAMAEGPVNCEAAPKAAVTTLPQGASDFAVVFCSPSGHALAAADGYVWIAPDRKPFLLHAASHLGARRGDSQHSVYFEKASSRVLRDEALEKSKAMFRTEFGFSPPTDTAVTQLDVQSSRGFRYNVFFYIVAGRLDRVIGCIDECSTSIGLTQVSLSSLR